MGEGHRRVVADAKRYLQQQLRHGVQEPGDRARRGRHLRGHLRLGGRQGLRLRPGQAAAGDQQRQFLANQPTLELANWAAQHGVKLYFLTGRNELQGAAALKNLANEGYPAPAGAFFKPKATAPAYLPCALTCTTVQYKSGTRAHIESTGAKIVLNVGDQFSDLEGGYARTRLKLPNPMYYLP